MKILTPIDITKEQTSHWLLERIKYGHHSPMDIYSPLVLFAENVFYKDASALCGIFVLYLSIEVRAEEITFDNSD